MKLLLNLKVLLMMSIFSETHMLNHITENTSLVKSSKEYKQAPSYHQMNITPDDNTPTDYFSMGTTESSLTNTTYQGNELCLHYECEYIIENGVKKKVEERYRYIYVYIKNDYLVTGIGEASGFEYNDIKSNYYRDKAFEAWAYMEKDWNRVDGFAFPPSIIKKYKSYPLTFRRVKRKVGTDGYYDNGFGFRLARYKWDGEEWQNNIYTFYDDMSVMIEEDTDKPDYKKHYRLIDPDELKPQINYLYE